MRKLLFLVLSIFVLSTAPVLAHCGTCGIGEAKGSHAEMDKKGSHGDMAKELGLTEEQQTAIKALKEEKHAKKAAAKEEYKTKMMEVLTPEQAEKYKAMKSDCACGKGEGECKKCALKKKADCDCGKADCKKCALKGKKEAKGSDKGSKMKKGSDHGHDHDEHKGSH